MVIEKIQRKTVVCIFAHPDDEAFGPAGTIAKLAQDNDVYILCATKGQAGIDSDDTHEEKLAHKRATELLESAKILGVKHVYFLGFQDGSLCNNVYHKLADKIQKHLEELKPDILVTFEHKGISGHIDHITVSLATTFVFERMPAIKTLLYYCISEERRAHEHNYFIYYPPGYKISTIHRVINIEDVWNTKVSAILAHKSQKHDADKHLSISEKLPKEEYFLILEK